MALDYTTVYPGQLDPGDPTGYPYGQARNIIVPGDGTGWPLERRWVNDILGFEQSLLDAAGIVPSGAPDKVGASQYLDAVVALIEDHEFQSLSVPGNASIGTDSTDLLTIAAGTIVTGPMQWDHDATFTAGLEVTGGTVDVNVNAFFNGNVTLGNAASDVIAFVGGCAFFGEVGMLAPLHVTAADFSSLVIFTGPVNFQDPVSLSGNGHIRKRVAVAPDSNATFGIDDADEIHVPDTLTAPRTYTLSTTNAAGGAQITICTYETTHAITFNGVPMIANSPGDPHCITWTFRSGAWHIQHVSNTA